MPGSPAAPARRCRSAKLDRARGLNLGFDRYAYDYGAFAWGRPDAEVKISCEWRGAVEPLAGAIAVADRRGCDIHPIDARDPAARARMLAYIWARPGGPPGRRRGRPGRRRATRPTRGSDRRGAVRGARAARRRLGMRAGAGAHDLLAISSRRPRPPSAPRSPRRRPARPKRARSPGCGWKPKPRSAAARCCASRSGRTDRSTKYLHWRFMASGSSGGPGLKRRDLRRGR